jgi:hypothetical protein
MPVQQYRAQGTCLGAPGDQKWRPAGQGIGKQGDLEAQGLKAFTHLDIEIVAQHWRAGGVLTFARIGHAARERLEQFAAIEPGECDIDHHLAMIQFFSRTSGSHRPSTWAA